MTGLVQQSATFVQPGDTNGQLVVLHGTTWLVGQMSVKRLVVKPTLNIKLHE